jgi:hypothetical protein
VALRRAKFVFDTHVVSYICDGVITRTDWDAVRQFISRRGRYAISAITLYELIASIAHGDDQHFSENQARLKILREPPKRKILPLTRDFIRSTIFHLPPQKPDFAPERMKIWIDVILAAKTKQEVRGPIMLPRSGNRKPPYGFDLSHLANHIKEGKRHNAAELEGLRQGAFGIPTTERWAESRLKECGVETSAQNVTTLLEAVDAARRYDFSLFSMAKNRAYDFGRHDSDWLDIMQLCYLADPLVHVVTSDANMKLRTRGSPQADRILTFDELKARALEDNP